MNEHIILVAFEVTAPSRAEAHEILTPLLPRPNGLPDPSPIECWWVAEDDRVDGSDNDSAVFVDPGKQHEASLLLANARMTADYNIVTREGGQFS